MRILITGATGLIGSTLSARFLRAGHELVLVSRNPKQSESKSQISAKFYAWEELPQALQGVEAVIHLAGENIGSGSWSEEQKDRIITSRTETTQKLYEALKAQDEKTCRVFLSASAVGIYGDQEDREIRESDFGQIFASSDDFLARVCRVWEKEINGVSTLGVRTVIFRLGMVLSNANANAKTQSALSRIVPLFKLGIGGQLGSGKQWMSWIHLEDACRLFETALEDPRYKGSYHAVAPYPVQNETFTKVLARLLHRPVFLPVPKIGLRLVLGEQAQIVLASQRVVPERLFDQGWTWNYPELESALKDCLREES